MRQDGRQGILPFVLEQAKRDDVTARAGLPLVVETMRALGLDELAGCALPQPKRQRGFAPEQKLEALVTLIAAGGDRVEDVRVLAVDKGLEKLLGVSFPSPDAGAATPVRWAAAARPRVRVGRGGAGSVGAGAWSGVMDLPNPLTSETHR